MAISARRNGQPPPRMTNLSPEATVRQAPSRLAKVLRHPRNKVRYVAFRWQHPSSSSQDGHITVAAGREVNMPSKAYFRNLAQMSRRIAQNMIDPAVAERLEAIGAEFDLQADGVPDFDADGLAPPTRFHQGTRERT